MNLEMPDIPTAWIVVLALFMVLLSVLSSLLERSGPIRIRHWSEGAGDRLRNLYARREHFEAFRLLLTSLARLLPIIVLALAWLRDASWREPVGVLIVLVLTEVWMRVLVRRNAERSLAALTPVYSAAYVLLKPAVWASTLLIGAVEATQDDDDDDASDEEIAAFIDVGRREGILEAEEVELVRSVVDFGDTLVRSVMTPRVEVNSASIEADFETLAAKFFDSKNSRLPLFRGSIDEIEGILHIRDLFEAMHHQEDVDVMDLCQTPHYVPENKPLPDLLAELQKLHQQMAIVVDEYGGMAGLVTVEDLLEEIVGEIRDEHEDDTDPKEVSSGIWRLAGRMNIEDLEDLVGVNLDAEQLPYETLSGMMCGELGYVPKQGETFQTHGLELAVDEADDRRVTMVTVSVGGKRNKKISAPTGA